VIEELEELAMGHDREASAHSTSSSSSCSEHDMSRDDCEAATGQKCSNKIKALQSILIKQSLPFANPAFFRESPARRSKSMDHLDEIKKTSTTKHESPDSPPPSHLSSVSSSSQKKCEEEAEKSLHYSIHDIGRPSHYSTLSRLEQHNGDDPCFNEETRSRIASVKDKLNMSCAAAEHDYASTLGKAASVRL
jgi:hypothetical protein